MLHGRTTLFLSSSFSTFFFIFKPSSAILSLIYASRCPQGSEIKLARSFDTIIRLLLLLHNSDWVCTAVMSNDVMKDLRG